MVSVQSPTFDVAADISRQKFEKEQTVPDDPSIVYARVGFRLSGSLSGWTDPKPAQIVLWRLAMRNNDDFIDLKASYDEFVTTYAEENSALVGRVDTAETNIGLNTGEITNILGLEVDEDSAMATLLTQMEVEVDGESAWIRNANTILNDVEGVSAGVMFEAEVDSNEVSLLELYSVSKPGEKYSVARLAADEILLEGTVKAPELSITEGWINLIDNGRFIYGDNRGWSDSLANYMTVQQSDGSTPGQSAATRWHAKINNGGVSRRAWISEKYAAEPGREYNLSFSFARTGNNVTTRFRMVLYNKAGQSIGTRSAYKVVNSNVWQNQTWTVTVPNGVAEIRFDLHTEASSGNLYVTDLEAVQKQKGATIIDEGSIETDRIKANTIIATNIKNNTLSNGQMALQSRAKRFNDNAGWTEVIKKTFQTYRNAPIGVFFSCRLAANDLPGLTVPLSTPVMRVDYRLLVDGSVKENWKVLGTVYTLGSAFGQVSSTRRFDLVPVMLFAGVPGIDPGNHTFVVQAKYRSGVASGPINNDPAYMERRMIGFFGESKR